MMYIDVHNNILILFVYLYLHLCTHTHKRTPIYTFTYTVKSVFKDLSWEVNNLVYVHGRSLIAGSFIQKISKVYKSMAAIDRELLFQGGL